MSLLAVIPARGGSKGIPRKNIRLLRGKPLIAYSIEAALNVDTIDSVIVSTEDEEIASIAKDYGAEVPFLRPKKLSYDDTPGVDPVLHLLEKLKSFNEILLLQPTSPLRTIEDIQGIIEFKRNKKCPSAVSICEVSKHPYWMLRLSPSDLLEPFIRHQSLFSLPRQQLEKAYVPNGALYICDIPWLKAQGNFVGPETRGYLMPTERSVDIDTQLDWLWAETLMHKGKE